MNYSPEYLKVKNWRLRNVEKYSAHKKVFIAVRNGTLIPKLCTCGETKTQAHHENYSVPLKVVWLCHNCHIEADKKRRHEEWLST